MSQQNIDVVRRGIDAFNRRDLPALLSDFDKDVEWVEDRRYPGAETFRGPSGVERSLGKWWDAWGEIALQLDGTIDLGDRVVLSGRVRARGHDSDVAVEAPFGGLYEFRSGKVVRVQTFGSRAEAVEAAGPKEYAPPQENVEVRALVQAAYGALNAGDLDGFLTWIAEDVEFTSMVAEAEGTIFRGHDGVRAWWETVRGAFEDVRWEVLDVRGSLEGGVTRFRMTGTLGGVPVAQTMWQASTARDGKATWWGFFRSEAEALEAVRRRE
jgi:uncharacterized protein